MQYANLPRPWRRSAMPQRRLTRAARWCDESGAGSAVRGTRTARDPLYMQPALPDEAAVRRMPMVRFQRVVRQRLHMRPEAMPWPIYGANVVRQRLIIGILLLPPPPLFFILPPQRLRCGATIFHFLPDGAGAFCLVLYRVVVSSRVVVRVVLCRNVEGRRLNMAVCRRPLAEVHDAVVIDPAIQLARRGRHAKQQGAGHQADEQSGACNVHNMR